MKFKYSGPMSGVTLNVGSEKEPKEEEFLFYDGKEYELPEKNSYVQALVARGHLEAVKASSAKKVKETENAS